MKTRLKKIGNSKGITLSKTLLEQYHFEDEVEIIASEDGLLIRPATAKSRENWEEQFKSLIKPGQKKDYEVINYFPNSFDEKDWTW
jgi:antitoxin MazE